MAKQANEIAEQERQTLNEMLFTLSERDRGTLAMAVVPNEWKRKAIDRFLKDHLKEYSFFELDLTSHTYTSLYRALQELLPVNILESTAVQYLVNVTGLESSLHTTQDGKIEFSSLLSQLNLERELIFNQPYIVFLWVSEGFDKELQKKAPDLMHWMSKRFVFEEEDAGGFEVAEAAVEYGEVKKKGKIPERLERIRQLEETWEKLKLHDQDQARLVKDKIALLLLLAKEYAAAFEFRKAESAFEKALSLNNKIKAGREGEIFYESGMFYCRFNKYDLSLQYFRKSFDEAEKKGIPDLGDVYHMLGIVYQQQRKWKEAADNYDKALGWYKKMGREYTLANTYHQLGRLSEEQRKWDEALTYYGQSLEWKKKTGNERGLGATYHQIGMVYEKQQKWEEALENYHQSLEWEKKTGNEYELGSTYHHIGRVYEEQRKWADALKNYDQALDWKTKTSNEYEMGSTYHQIGRVYEGQQKWEEALVNYGQSLDWKTKTSNEYEMGGTYHQIGRVYEEQQKWEEALKNYHQALEWKIKSGNEYELGATYYHIGKTYEAKDALSQALEWYEKGLQNQLMFDRPNLQMDRDAITRVRQKLTGLKNSNPFPPTP